MTSATDINADDSSISRCPLCGSNDRPLYVGADLMFHGTEEFEYRLCNQCGASYQNPMPEPDRIAEFYPQKYRIYEQPVPMRAPRPLELAVLKYARGYQHLQAPQALRYLVPLARLFLCREDVRYVPRGKLLDIGCGSGRFLRRMRSLGWDCQGVDFSTQAIDVCRSQGLAVHHGDLASAQFSHATFDVVAASHSIEHMSNPDAFVSESARILRHGGVLVVRTPNSHALGRKWFGPCWFADDVPRHLVHFSLDNLDMLAVRHGLHRVRTRLNTSPKYILNSIDYRLGAKGSPSRKRKLRRLAAKLYVILATLVGRGDEIFAVYEKS